MTSATYKISEARARFSELLKRAQAGEEILVMHGNDPIARIVPAAQIERPRPGRLRELLSEEEIAALTDAVEAPLTEREQRILEGDGTDDLGIWIGLPEDREAG